MTNLNKNASPGSKVEASIADIVIQIFSDHLAIEIESPESDLIEEGLLDSLAVVELLMQLELKFGFTVEMEELDIEDLRTVRCIEEYVSRNID